MSLEPDEVLVAIPLALAAQVLRMRAEYRSGLPQDEQPAGEPETTGPPPPPASLEATEPGYTQEEVTLLKSKIREHGYRGVEALFSICAERRDWVLKAEAETSVGMTAVHLRNQLRSLSWLVKSLFGEGKGWPIAVQRWGGLFYYRLHPQVADWWQAVG